VHINERIIKNKRDINWISATLTGLQQVDRGEPLRPPPVRASFTLTGI
jgi:peptidoglycan lytic transglycosylase